MSYGFMNEFSLMCFTRRCVYNNNQCGITDIFFSKTITVGDVVDFVFIVSFIARIWHESRQLELLHDLLP